jgi:predicted RNA-binding protein YlxR (DUF448 family)
VADRPSASPTRTCVGCRMRASQSDLVRVVVRHGRAWLDPQRSSHGRGAYLHPRLECLDLAERRRVWGRALRWPGGPTTDGLRDQLQQYLASISLARTPKAGRDGDEHAMSAQQ